MDLRQGQALFATMYVNDKGIWVGVGPLLLAPLGRPHTDLCFIVELVYQGRSEPQALFATMLGGLKS
jgi:hypothetical protein